MKVTEFTYGLTSIQINLISKETRSIFVNYSLALHKKPICPSVETVKGTLRRQPKYYTSLI